jgi:hypothetical protein
MIGNLASTIRHERMRSVLVKDARDREKCQGFQEVQDFGKDRG